MCAYRKTFGSKGVVRKGLLIGKLISIATKVSLCETFVAIERSTRRVNADLNKWEYMPQ